MRRLIIARMERLSLEYGLHLVSGPVVNALTGANLGKEVMNPGDDYGCDYETRREISTEIECDRDTFRDLPFVVAQVVCPHCECEHVWSKSDAWLEDCRPKEL